MPKDSPQRTATDAETKIMHELIDRAREAARASGPAGIAAAIMNGDTLLARGINEVHLNHDPTRHAEIVAISAATRALGETRLEGCTLLTTLQPCEMCLAAMRFAGIRRVIYAAGRPNIPTEKYFAFPGLQMADFNAADHEDFTVISGLCEHRILDIYAAQDE
jgi:tRNA(Arg) A34 adenosine deaminase TadA